MGNDLAAIQSEEFALLERQAAMRQPREKCIAIQSEEFMLLERGND